MAGWLNSYPVSPSVFSNWFYIGHQKNSWVLDKLLMFFFTPSITAEHISPQVESEITMLRQVLGSKVRHAAELKRKLGITPFQEFKQDLQQGIQHIKSSDSWVTHMFKFIWHHESYMFIDLPICRTFLVEQKIALIYGECKFSGETTW